MLAQLVFVLATPILTRIYTPEQLGTFGLYSAVVIIMAKLAGFRYELAIPLPRQDRVAANLILLTSILTVVPLVIVYALYTEAANYFDLSTETHELHNYAALIMLGVAMFVFNETLIFWSIRQKQFRIIASARVINAFCLAILQLSGYLFDATLHLLIASYPLSLFISILYQLKKLDLELLIYRGRRWRLLRILLIRYRNFPMYTTLSSGLFELSQALPLFVLTYYFGNQQAGYFFLARRIGLMPVSLVGRAISQVNHAEMLEHHKSGGLGEIMLDQIHKLQWISIAPAFLLACFAPQASEMLFGEGWRVAGLYMQLMAPYVVVRFVFSPLTAINNVAEWQRSGFWFEITSSALSTIGLIWYCLQGNAVLAVASYFIVMVIANLGYRVFLMKRLGVGVFRLLKPGLIQLPALAAIALLVLIII